MTDKLALIHDYGLDIDNREIYLFGREESKIGVSEIDDLISEPGVDFMLSNQFIKNIRILEKKDAPILVHMKTCGGMWQEGMAIYDAIKACPNHVTIVNYTHARSMSSIILQAADKRVMMPYSTFMFHEGTQGFQGTVKQLRTEYKESEKAMDQMLDIYVEAAGVKKKWLKSQMDKKEEVYLSADEAVEQGFADCVFENWKCLK